MSVGWGVIGAGGIADRRTIPEGLVPSAMCNLVAVMDIDAGRAWSVAERHGVPAYDTSVEALLARQEVEAVYIATPNHLHKEQVLAAAAAGKHVFVEKPLALSVADAEEMVDACERAGVKLMVGYLMRFHAYHRHLKAMIEAGDLGQVVFGRAQLTCWYPPMEGAWRQNLALGGGGAFIDMGTHCLDLLEMLIGRARQVSAFMGTLTHGYEVEDSATVLVEFEGGAQGIVDVNFNVPDAAAQNVLEVRGSVGAVLADHTIGQEPDGRMVAWLPKTVGGYDAAQARTEQGVRREIDVTPVNTYRAEVEHFVECIESGAEPLTGGKEAIRFVQVTERVYEAARSGKVMEL
jgi:predicted dehydrogenase